MWKKRMRPTFNHLALLHLPPRGHNITTEISCNFSSFGLFLFVPSIARARAHSSSIMDVVAAVSGYISKMVTAGESASGSSSTKMKILLLDSETVGLALDQPITGHDRLITDYPGIHCLDRHHPIRPPEP